MKKGIIVLLVAVLAASLAFAGVTGSASFSAGYDLEEKAFTLDNAKSGATSFKFEFDAESGATADSESAFYAKMSASYEANITKDGFAGKLTVKDAEIGAADGLWSVNLTKVANGLELTYAGNALDVYYKNPLTWGVKATSKTFEVAEGITVKANVAYDVAKNDLTDPANYSWDFDEDTAKAIAKAKKGDAYFGTYDDGTYKNATLAAKQAAVTAAEEDVADAKEAFAANPSRANYDAIGAAEEALKDAKKALTSAEAVVEEEFKDAHPEWYKATPTYTVSEKWVVDGETEDYTEDSGETIIAKVNLKSSASATTKNYIYFNETTGLYEAYKQGEAFPVDSNIRRYQTVVTAPKAANLTKKAYLIRVESTSKTYKDNTSKYVYLADEGTATLSGGIEVAYASEKLNATVAVNGGYEFLAKDVSYAVAAKASYDFVSGGVSYDSDSILSANVGAKLDDIIGMPLSVSVEVSDILSKGDDKLVVTGKASTEVAGATIEVAGKFDTDPDKGNGRTSGSVGVGYSMEMATIKASVAVRREAKFGDDHNYGANGFVVSPTVTVSNTTLIDNATLSLAYAGAQFGGREPNNGAVTATVGIKF